MVDVRVCEVGLRDGLQLVADFFPTAEKLAWIAAEAAAGVRQMEVTSLVPAQIVPQFADAEVLIGGALAIPDLSVIALIPNLRGAERGLALGVHQFTFVMSVSRTHNLKNVRREREASLEDLRRIVALRNAQPEGRRPSIMAALSTALGCSYEGPVAVDEVCRWAAQLAEAGADEIMVADTVGYGDPARVRAVFSAVIDAVGPLPVGAHFHDTRGTGLANVTAALEAGVRRFDASLGGLGGCPFAPGASGNIVMEDLVFMLDSMGLRTGIDMGALLAVREIVARNLPAVELFGALARAGLPRGYRSAEARAAGPAERAGRR